MRKANYKIKRTAYNVIIREYFNTVMCIYCMFERGYACYFIYLLVYMRMKWRSGLVPFSSCVCSISTRWSPWGLPSMPHQYPRWRQAALPHLWSAQQDWHSDLSLRSHLGQAALMVTLRVREKEQKKKKKGSNTSSRLIANVLLEFKALCSATKWIILFFSEDTIPLQ